MVIPGRYVDLAHCIAGENGFSLEMLRQSNRSAAHREARKKVALVLRAEGASYEEVGHVLQRHRTSVMAMLGQPGRVA
jgi:hypothetical protein